MKNSFRFERLNPSQLAKAVRTRPIAWLPIGPLEWHGEAIALGCDPLIGTAVVEQAWRKAGGVLLPTLYAGVGSVDKKGYLSGFFEQFGIDSCMGGHNPGSVYNRPLSFELVINDILFFLEYAGFKLCVLNSWHGDGWHIAILKKIEENWRGRPMRFVYWSNHEKSLKPYPKAWTREINRTGVAWNVPSGSHGDFNEASCMGAIDPALVDKRLFGRAKRDRSLGIRSENAALIDYDKGKKILGFQAKRMAAEVSRLCAEILKSPETTQHQLYRKWARAWKDARPLNPPVGAWKVSPPLRKAGGMAKAPCLKLSAKLAWRNASSSIYYFANGAAGWKVDLKDKFKDAAGLAYIGNRFKVAEGGQWAILLGHDGPARVFVDGMPVFYEPRQENPVKLLVHCYRFHRRAYRSIMFAHLAPGIHEVMIVLDARDGIGDGITFRFLPTSGIAALLETWEQV